MKHSDRTSESNEKQKANGFYLFVNAIWWHTYNRFKRIPQRWTLCLPIETQYVSWVAFRLICNMESRHKKGWITAFPQYTRKVICAIVFTKPKRIVHMFVICRTAFCYSMLVFFSFFFRKSPNCLSRNVCVSRIRCLSYQRFFVLCSVHLSRPFRSDMMPTQAGTR